jgi:hypothetical protein
VTPSPGPCVERGHRRRRADRRLAQARPRGQVVHALQDLDLALPLELRRNNRLASVHPPDLLMACDSRAVRHTRLARHPTNGTCATTPAIATTTMTCIALNTHALYSNGTPPLASRPSANSRHQTQNITGRCARAEAPPPTADERPPEDTKISVTNLHSSRGPRSRPVTGSHRVWPNRPRQHPHGESPQRALSRLHHDCEACRQTLRNPPRHRHELVHTRGIPRLRLGHRIVLPINPLAERLRPNLDGVARTRSNPERTTSPGSQVMAGSH